MNMYYAYKLGRIELCSEVGCFPLYEQRKVGFLRLLLIWITKGPILKAMTFYFTENEPLTMPWHHEDEHPFAPKSQFSKKVRLFRRAAFVFLTGVACLHNYCHFPLENTSVFLFSVYESVNNV